MLSTWLWPSTRPAISSSPARTTSSQTFLRNAHRRLDRDATSRERRSPVIFIRRRRKKLLVLTLTLTQVFEQKSWHVVRMHLWALQQRPAISDHDIGRQRHADLSSSPQCSECRLILMPIGTACGFRLGQAWPRSFRCEIPSCDKVLCWCSPLSS